MATENNSINRRPKRNKKTHHPIPPKDVQQPLPHLPHEIIVDILSRLPVKSLLRFRSVSKSWLSSISCPKFVKTHLSIASKSCDYTHHRLILSSLPHFNAKSCSLNSLLNEESDNVVKLDNPDRDLNPSLMIVGSCNGLVCIGTDFDSMFLWNPCTGQSKKLPNRGFSEEHGGLTMRFGFGCGESDDDYKVVVIFSDDDDGWGSYETRVEVYTLKTDSWKRIGDFSYGIPTDYTGQFANGSLHWLAPGKGSGYTHVIASLDLVKETHGEVMLPNYDDVGCNFGLFVLRGCLGAMCVYPRTRADVWVRKEYGVTNSWTKLFTLPYRPVPWMTNLSAPLCISKNCEILMNFGQRLGLYSLEKGTFRKLVIPNFCPSVQINQMRTYVGSFVSPNDHHVVQRQHR